MNLASLADQNLAEFGEYERLVFEGRTYTNRALHEESCRISTALTGLGLERDDKVVVMMPNRPEVFLSYAAIWRAGLIAIPVLFLLEARELRYILENSRARAVITSTEMVEKVQAALADVRHAVTILVVGEPDAVPAGCTSLVRISERAAPRREVAARSPDDIATILYTSGTTGQPKGVMQTHKNLHANAMNSWNTATNRKRGETGLLVLPLAHSFGLGALLSGYLFGGRAVLLPWFNAERVLSLIQEYAVEAMSGVPAMFVSMLLHPKAKDYDTSSVRRWLVGAAPMPTEQLREFEATFGGTLYVGYGLTESCPGIAVEREGMPRKSGSTGVAMEGVAIKIVDDSGSELPRGETGEVCARGDNISPGYYENPEATREAFRDGWLYTGDMGFIDDDGYLFIVERKKDLIIRGGFNVYPKDVEEVIHQHPAVAEAAVVGVPDPRMGEEVCLYVVKRRDAEVTAEELIRHAQANLAKYKTPKFVEFVSSLPRTPIGKIQKKELRRMAKERFSSG